MREIALTNKSKLYIFLEALGFAVITVALGWIVGMVGGADTGYTGLVRPAFTPPDIVFSIVWPVLYAMIGVSLYITVVTKTRNNALRIASFIIWGVQLALNFLWVPVFFNERQNQKRPKKLSRVKEHGHPQKIECKLNAPNDKRGYT